MVEKRWAIWCPYFWKGRLAPPDRTYSRLARGKFLPILGLALTKRRDHSHAGNNDDRTIATVAHRRPRIAQLGECHASFRKRRHETASKSAIPSPRQ